MKVTGWSMSPTAMSTLLSQPLGPVYMIRPCAVSTVPSVIGMTSSVVIARLPRTLPRSRYATGTDASTLTSAAGTPSPSVVTIVFRRYGSEKNVE